MLNVRSLVFEVQRVVCPSTIVADAQIARLMQCGACDVAVTEDADLIAYVTRKRLLGLGVCVNGVAGMVVG